MERKRESESPKEKVYVMWRIVTMTSFLPSHHLNPSTGFRKDTRVPEKLWDITNLHA
jgi:hypothetical protein